MVLVSSAKGGVGKSTVCANLAGALSLAGNRVGIVDCDIYGPSQNLMFGITEPDADIHQPIESQGIVINSIANRVATGKSIAWRGPMLKVAVMDLIQRTHWGELDYLLVDMPPGTGDIQLAMCEKFPESVAVIVTTPQDVATTDTERGLDLYRNAGIAVLGVIENMCGYVCSGCGKTEYIFGRGGGAKLAQQHQIPFLGEIPIETQIRSTADTGTPVVFDRDGAVSKLYMSMASQITAHK